MHQRTARIVSLLYVAVALMGVGFAAFSYLQARETTFREEAEAADRARLAEQERLEAMRQAEAEADPPAPEERYVPPDPITYPFY